MTDAERAPLVIIQGMAGTAKTFYSLAVGLDKVYNMQSNEYRRGKEHDSKTSKRNYYKSRKGH